MPAAMRRLSVANILTILAKMPISRASIAFSRTTGTAVDGLVVWFFRHQDQQQQKPTGKPADPVSQ